MKIRGSFKTEAPIVSHSLACCCSVTHSCPTLYDPMDHSMLGFPVLHCLPQFAQTHVIESMMPSNHLILCHPLLLLPSIFHSIRVFSNESALCTSGQSIEAAALASVLTVNIQGWLPLGLAGWISLQYKGLSRIFSNTTDRKHQLFGTQPSLWYNPHSCTWLLEKHSFDHMDLCWQSDVSAF